MTDDIRAILKEHGRITADVDSLADDADLFKAGMSSHASVNVMLALEAKFDVEFPEEMMKREVFATISALRAAVEQLTQGR